MDNSISCLFRQIVLYIFKRLTITLRSHLYDDLILTRNIYNLYRMHIKLSHSAYYSPRNIICTPKMRNELWFIVKMQILYGSP